MTAPSATTLTCADGRNFDLLHPSIVDVSFAVICEHLAKANRYGGATPGVVFSVAQHSVLCAWLALRETGDRELAAYLLCHDMHEAYLGDDTTPKKRALAVIMKGFGVLASQISESFASLTNGIDAVIHARAGLAWPPSAAMQAEIHKWDRVLLSTEWRDLMTFPTPGPFEYEAHGASIVPHACWQDAAAQMLSACVEYLPNGSL